MQRSLATSSIESAQLFSKLSFLLQDVECQKRSALSSPVVDDQFGRFRIWAGNLGAFQRPPSTASLDHRLRESLKVASEIQELLQDLQDALHNVLAIANGERPNRQYESDDEDSESELDIEANPNPSTQDRCGSDDETSRLSEAEELFESAKQTIASLFRISIIIRKASPRDRFVKALSAKQTPFDDSFDISHVGNKFPLLRSDDKRWLKERLGKAIAQRRQYLRYARDHRHKLSKEPTELWQPGIVEDPSIQVPVADWSARSQAAHTNFTKPSSTLAPTTASTLHIASIPPPEKDFQDDISQTSYAVSLGEENDDSHLQLPRLTDISNGATTFECPLCWTIQSIHKETAWKKHGYTDLRPYVCTFQECDLKLFSDRRDWFDHEMQHHRAKWDCHFCGKGNFNSLDRFEVHLRSFHAQDATDDQLDALGEACKSPVDRIAASDCPFCEDWERKLLQANADISTNETIVVTPSQFKHHVGSHMQQLALFAIPRGYLEVEADATSNASNEAVDNANSEVCEVSQHDSEDATQTQQEQSENMNEQNENRESDQQTGVSSPQANMQMNMLADNEYRLLFEPGDPEGTLLVFRAVLERERSSDERISQVRAIFAKFDAQELQNKKDHCAIEGVYIAAKFGDVPLASFLWGYDGNPLSIPEGKHSVVGERVLDIALKHGHFDFVEFLFEHDIDKQVTNEELLHKAEERLALHNKIPSHPKQSEIFGDEPIGNRTYKAVDYSPKAEPFHPIDPVPGTLPKRFPCWCKALYSWGGETKRDLGFLEGELIECLNAGDGSWWVGRLKRDRRMVGLFPSNFVQLLDDDYQPLDGHTSPLNHSDKRSISRQISEQQAPPEVPSSLPSITVTQAEAPEEEPYEGLKDDLNVEPQSIEAARHDSKVTWGENQFHNYEARTPDSYREQYVSDHQESLRTSRICGVCGEAISTLFSEVTVECIACPSIMHMSCSEERGKDARRDFQCTDCGVNLPVKCVKDCTCLYEGDMIRCTSCYTVQHRDCYGYRSEHPYPSEHRCWDCDPSQLTGSIRNRKLGSTPVFESDELDSSPVEHEYPPLEASNTRRPSTQLKSPLPALTTLQTPLPDVLTSSNSEKSPATVGALPRSYRLDWIEQYEREHADSERDPQRLRERANQEFERRSIRIIEARSKKAAERKANWEKTEKLEEMPDEKKE